MHVGEKIKNMYYRIEFFKLHYIYDLCDKVVKWKIFLGKYFSQFQFFFWPNVSVYCTQSKIFVFRLLAK